MDHHSWQPSDVRVRVLRKRARMLAASVRTFEQSLARQFKCEVELVRSMSPDELQAYEGAIDNDDAAAIMQVVLAAVRRTLAER